MEQNQKLAQDIQEAGAKIKKAFEKLGSALQKLANKNKAYVIVTIADLMNCDATLRKWYKQLETARGSKRRRIRRKIKKRVKRHINGWMFGKDDNSGKDSKGIIESG